MEVTDEMIAAYRSARILARTNANFDPVELDRVGIEAALAAAPVSDDAKDAARYRWLRNSPFALVSYAKKGSDDVEDWICRSGEQLDAGIDAAIAKIKHPHEG